MTTSFPPLSTVRPVGPAALPERVVIGELTSRDAQRHRHLRGDTGAHEWTWTSAAAEVAVAAADGLHAHTGPYRLLVIDRQPSGCAPLVASTVDSRTGRTIRRAQLGAALRPGEDQLNIVSAGTGPFSATTDALILELRTYRGTGGVQSFSPEYRDITPRRAMRGAVVVVTAAGDEVLRLDQPPLVGPGPVAGWTRGTRDAAVVALTTFRSGPEEPLVEVRAFAGTRRLWRTTMRSLPAAWAFVDTAVGPAFITSRPADIDLGLPTRYRIAVLDRHTGSLRWTKDIDGGAGGVVFKPLAGDLLLDDLGHQRATRLSAATGAVEWSTQYATTTYAHHRLVGDHLGSPVPELLLPDSVAGPQLLSGRDGSATLRPTLAPAAAGSISDVGDLDGDGVHDLAAVGGAGAAVGVVGSHPTAAVLAYSGRTGSLLWHGSVDAVNVDTHLSGIQVTPAQRAVVVLQASHAVTGFAGADGSPMWRVPLGN